MSQYNEVVPEKINIVCTDNGQKKEAFLDRYVEGKYMDVIVNTIRLKLVYTGKIYKGSMAGLEFTAESPKIEYIKQGR